MKMTYMLAAATLLLATFAFHPEASATLVKTTYEGHVMDVNTDEEGSSIILKTTSGFTQSVYAPRSRANEEIVERAVKARGNKTIFRISTQL